MLGFPWFSSVDHLLRQGQSVLLRLEKQILTVLQRYHSLAYSCFWLGCRLDAVMVDY